MDDSGEYRIQVAVGEFEAEGSIHIAVIDKPSQVRKLKILDVIGNSAALEWEPPFDEGNCEMQGYKILRRDKRSGPDGEWYVCYERLRRVSLFLEILPVHSNQSYFPSVSNQFKDIVGV